MSGASSTTKKATPQEVNDLVLILHDQGVINLDTPMRGALQQASGLRTGTDDGWYIIGGSSWAIVVSE